MIRDPEDSKYSHDHIYHIMRGPHLDEVTFCRSYSEYLEYFGALRKAGKGTRYCYTQQLRTGRGTQYHYYLREVVEDGKVTVS